MGEALHATLSLLIATAAVFLNDTRRPFYWRIVWLLVLVSLTLPLLFNDTGPVPLLFGGNRWLFRLVGSALMFGVPILAAAGMGDSAKTWRWPGIAFLAVPAAYFAALFLALVLGTNAGVLVP